MERDDKRNYPGSPCDDKNAFALPSPSSPQRKRRRWRRDLKPVLCQQTVEKSPSVQTWKLGRQMIILRMGGEISSIVVLLLQLLRLFSSWLVIIVIMTVSKINKMTRICIFLMRWQRNRTRSGKSAEHYNQPSMHQIARGNGSVRWGWCAILNFINLSTSINLPCVYLQWCVGESIGWMAGQIDWMNDGDRDRWDLFA